MKKSITTLALAVTILLTMTSPVLAANGTAPNSGCQQGADNDIVGSWQLLSLEEFAEFLVEEFDYPSYEIALERAENTYAFCDHNGDNYTCAMVQNLPNDASGRSKYWLVEDNHPFGGK